MSNRQLVILALLALAALTVAGAFFTVEPGERVALFELGRLKGADYAPGLHLKLPFAQSVSRFDGRLLTLESQTENFATREQKSVRVDYFVKWRIADTLAYYRATGGQELSADDRLSAIVNRGLRDEFAARTIQQIIAGGADEMTAALVAGAGAGAAELGIALVDARVKRIDLPDEIRDSYYDRMRAERTRVASETRAQGEEEAEKIRAEADREAEAAVANSYRDAETTRGQGDARAAEIYAKAYGQDPEFYNFYRSLNVYRDSFHGQQDVLVLEPKGEFFRYFKQSEPGR